MAVPFLVAVLVAASAAYSTSGYAQGESPDPGGSALVNCGSGGVDLTLTNPGSVPASFTLTVDGVDVPVADVPAFGQASEFVPFGPDGTVHVELVSGDETFVDQVFTRDCAPAPVASDPVDSGAPPADAADNTQPEVIALELARTGTDLRTPALIGLLLIVIGVPLTRTNRQRPKHRARRRFQPFAG
ncbi:MAG: hypothetical protein QOG30_3461 [Acidimicrobiaceae bacterium]